MQSMGTPFLPTWLVCWGDRDTPVRSHRGNVKLHSLDWRSGIGERILGLGLNDSKNQGNLRSVACSPSLSYAHSLSRGWGNGGSGFGGSTLF